MKKIYQILVVVMMLGAMPALTSCNVLWEGLYGNDDEPVSNHSGGEQGGTNTSDDGIAKINLKNVDPVDQSKAQ